MLHRDAQIYSAAVGCGTGNLSRHTVGTLLRRITRVGDRLAQAARNECRFTLNICSSSSTALTMPFMTFCY